MVASYKDYHAYCNCENNHFIYKFCIFKNGRLLKVILLEDKPTEKEMDELLKEEIKKL